MVLNVKLSFLEEFLEAYKERNVLIKKMSQSTDNLSNALTGLGTSAGALATAVSNIANNTTPNSVIDDAVTKITSAKTEIDAALSTLGGIPQAPPPPPPPAA